MTTEESLKQFGLIPSDGSLTTIRRLLAHEVQLEREFRGCEREEDLALLCCVQLFSRGQLDDVLRIWSAKAAGMDLGVTIDVQLLCGAGLDATKAFLAQRDEISAGKALAYIEDCERTDDFEDFSPESQLQLYRAYFRC